MMIVGMQQGLVVHCCTEEVPPCQQRQYCYMHINCSLTMHCGNVQPGKQGIRSRQRRTAFVMDRQPEYRLRHGLMGVIPDSERHRRTGGGKCA